MEEFYKISFWNTLVYTSGKSHDPWAADYPLLGINLFPDANANESGLRCKYSFELTRIVKLSWDWLQN